MKNKPNQTKPNQQPLEFTYAELMLGAGGFAEPRRQAMIGLRLVDRIRIKDAREKLEARFDDGYHKNVVWHYEESYINRDGERVILHPKYVRDRELRHAMNADMKWVPPQVKWEDRLTDWELSAFAEAHLWPRRYDGIVAADSELMALNAALAREPRGRGLIAPPPVRRSAFVPMAAITQDREMLAAWGVGERAVDALYRKRMSAKSPKKVTKFAPAVPAGELMAKKLLAEMPKFCSKPTEQTVLRVLSLESETPDGAEWAIWQMEVMKKPGVFQPRQHQVEVEVKVSLTEGMTLGWVGATPVRGARIPRAHKERRVRSRPLPAVVPLGVRLGDVWATTGQPQPARSVAVKAVKAARAVVEASEPVMMARVSRAPQWMRRPEMVSAQ